MMANIVFKIDNADFSDCLEEGGLKWTRNDLDAEGSGRNLAGDMDRNRVAVKWKLDVTTIPLLTSRISQLLNAIYPQWINVTATNPMLGDVTLRMYSNNVPATCQRQYGDSVLWDGISFPLIQR